MVSEEDTGKRVDFAISYVYLVWKYCSQMKDESRAAMAKNNGSRRLQGVLLPPFPLLAVP